MADYHALLRSDSKTDINHGNQRRSGKRAHPAFVKPSLILLGFANTCSVALVLGGGIEVFAAIYAIKRGLALTIVLV